MIHMIIADDHAVTRDSVRRILERAGDFEVAYEAPGGTQVMQLVRDHQPQVIVLDPSMPGRSGFELLRQLHDDHPRVHVLVLTMYAEEQYVACTSRAGAAGYLTKESAATELVTALQKVVNGGTYISPPMAEKLAHSLGESSEEAAHTRLSDREVEVYHRLVRGEPLTEVATSLCASAKAINTCKMRLMDKLQLSSEAALVRYAIRHRLLSDDDTLQLVPCWTRPGLTTYQWLLPPNRYR